MFITCLPNARASLVEIIRNWKKKKIKEITSNVEPTSVTLKSCH